MHARRLRARATRETCAHAPPLLQLAFNDRSVCAAILDTVQWRERTRVSARAAPAVARARRRLRGHVSTRAAHTDGAACFDVGPGTDRARHAILLFRPAALVGSAVSAPAGPRPRLADGYIARTVETTLQAMEGGGDGGARGYRVARDHARVCFVIDCARLGFSELQAVFGVMRGELPVLQRHYPNRLGAVYVVGLAGSLAGALWWLAGPLLDEQTKKKVRFVSRPDGLHAHIHPRFVKAAALGGAPIGE